MFWILPTPLEPSIIVARTLIDRLLSTLAGAFNRETVSQGPFSPSSSIHPVHCFAKWQAGRLPAQITNSIGLEARFLFVQFGANHPLNDPN